MTTAKKRLRSKEYSSNFEEKNVKDLNETPKIESKSTKVTTTRKNLTTCITTLKYVLQVLFLMFIIPIILNFAALSREEKEFKPAGLFIDVNNGQKLFKHCVGKGGPTVILDAPLGQTSDVWNLVQPALAKFTKVCMYDRTGLGYSDRPLKVSNGTQKSGKLYTVERMVEDFHQLFDSEEKPYVLVGADLGSTVSKFYTQIFPDVVAGLVLINPLFENLFVGEGNPWTKYWFHSHLPSLQLQHISASLGFTRIALHSGFLQQPLEFEETPEVVKKRQKYLMCKPGHVSSLVEESYYLNESLSQTRMLQKIRPLPSDMSVSVIWTELYSKKMSKDQSQVWLKSQELFMKTLGGKVKGTFTLRGYLPKALFTHSNRIVEIIKKSVHSVRQRRTSKY